MSSPVALAEEPRASLDDPVAGAARPHQLRANVVTLGQGVVIGLGTSAPGQSTAVVLAAMVAATAYATGPGIIIGMLPMLAIALCYRRLNVWKQNCGGPYVWAGRAISPYLGYLVAWTMLLGFSAGSISNLLPLGPAVLSFFGLDASGLAGNLLTTTLFGLAVTVLAAVGLRTTIRFQLTIAAIEYAILLVFSGIAFYAVFVGHWRGTVHPSLGWLSPNGIGGHGNLAQGVLISVFLFSGWDAPMYLNEESTRRARNPGRAVLIAVALLGPLYAWLFVSFQGVVSPSHLQANGVDALPYLASALVGSGWAKVMVLAVVLSVLGTAQATIVATSRVTYSMGTDALLPPLFARVSRRFGTPIGAAVFWGIATVVVADVCAASSSLSSAFNVVANDEGTLFSCFWAATACATVAYYRRLITRSVTDVFLVAVLPLAAAGVLIWVVVRSFPGLSATSHWTLAGAAALGLVLMAFFAFVRRSPFFSMRRETYEPESTPLST